MVHEKIEERELRLTTEYIIDLLGNPEFYDKCVAYFFLRDRALAVVEKYRAKLEDAECKPCARKQEAKNLAADVVQTFVSITIAIFGHKPELLQPVREFIQEQLPYPLGPILMYYRHQGEDQNIQF